MTLSTSSLPKGTANTSYTATLAATGGKTPYTWRISSGSLPAGLALSSAGVISGTPTTAANASIGFTVTDASSPAVSASKTLGLTISAASNTGGGTGTGTGSTGNITLSITPTRGSLVAHNGHLSFTATTNDTAGVTWSISPSVGDTFSPATSTSGRAVTLNSGNRAGVYTVTATSVSDGSKSASATIGETDLAGVTTYHNDLNRDGVNSQEYALTPANVNTTSFGKLFSCAVDGAVYAQPLWVPGVQINGAFVNMVIVATEHDSLYAFDADNTSCTTLWKVSLIDSAHGAAAGETSVPYTLVGGGGNVSPEIGITGTPVIDASSGTIYVIAKSVDSSQSNFTQRLHAINEITGAERPGAPITIQATYPGSGDGGSTDTFLALKQFNRSGLAFANGTVYAAFASHGDADPYYGWVLGYTYNGSSFAQTHVLNVAPNVRRGGIWMGGGAPAADSSGNLYLLTGNAPFNATNGSAPNNDYGDSMLKLSAGLGVSQYFTPSAQATENSSDLDFGGGGAAILADLPASSPIQHLIMGGGKDGNLYVLNRDQLGGYGDGNAWQMINFSYGIYSTGAFWNNTFFLRGNGGPLESFNLNPGSAQFSAGPISNSVYGFPGSSPAVSATGTSQGIVWDINNQANCHGGSGCGPSVLHAYDATNIASELWNSSMVGSDAAGNAVKFTVPTIANGHVYIGTQGNNSGGSDSSTSTPGELDVYGLKP